MQLAVAFTEEVSLMVDVSHWSFESILIAVVLVAAGIALLLVALRVYNIPLPPWAYHVLGIVAVTVVVIAAIRLLFSM